MIRRVAFVVAVALVPFSLAALAAGCSDPPPKPGPSVGGSMPVPIGGGGAGGEGGIREGGVTDGGVDAEGGLCNTIALGSLIVDRNAVATDPPAATGGTIVEGQYELTADTVYVGASGTGGQTGITMKATLLLASGKITEVKELGGVGKTATTTRTSGGYAATGVTFAETEFCPTTGGGRQLQFTANPPTLILTDLVSKEAFTFTKR